MTTVGGGGATTTTDGSRTPADVGHRGRAPDPGGAGGGRPWRSTALAGGVVVAAGLATSTAGSGALADAAGDALYAALVLLVARVVAHQARRGTQAAVALALCWAVEIAQATGAPAAAVAAWSPLRYLLGTTFAWADLLWYAVGVLATWGVMVVASGRRGGARRTATHRS